MTKQELLSEIEYKIDWHSQADHCFVDIVNLILHYLFDEGWCSMHELGDILGKVADMLKERVD